MNPNEMITAITALAIAISNILTEDELEITAAIFSQLGDTLNTISTQKSILADNTETKSE